MNRTIITRVGLAVAVSVAAVVIVAAVNSRAKQQPAAYSTNLGHPVFRTHGIDREQGVKLLQSVIAP